MSGVVSYLDKSASQARESRPSEPPPRLSGVDRTFRQLLSVLLKGYDCEENMETGVGLLCRTLASMIAQIEDLQRRH